MSKEDVSTPKEEEVKEESTEAEVTPEETKEETIASAIEDKENKIPDSIPYNRFQEKVSENKELKDRIAELEQSVQNNELSKRDVSSEVSDIAQEFGVDEGILEKLAQKLQAKAEQSIEEKLAPLTAKEKHEKQDRVLTNMLNKALESRPEFADVVDPDVIKQLALNPANADKTMTQLIEKTYGKAVKPSEKKTMETTAPGKSEAIEDIDYDRAQRDSEYFAKIKADPGLHEKYNAKMLEKMGRYM